MAERIGVPLRHHDNRLLWLACLFFRVRRIPPRIYLVIFRIRRPHRRSKTKIFSLFYLSSRRIRPQFGRLCERLRPHIRRKQFWMPLLQSEIDRRLISKEAVAIRNHSLVPLCQLLSSGTCILPARSNCTPTNGRVPTACPAMRRSRVRPDGQSSSQSKPHSSGRTIRFSSRVVSAVSHANMRRAYHSANIFLLYRAPA